MQRELSALLMLALAPRASSAIQPGTLCKPLNRPEHVALRFVRCSTEHPQKLWPFLPPGSELLHEIGGDGDIPFFLVLDPEPVLWL